MFSLPNHIHVYEFSLGRRRSVSSIKPSLACRGATLLSRRPLHGSEAAVCLATSKPLLCPEYWAELQPHTVILTPTHFSSLPQPERSLSQVSICRPSSFISQKIPFTFSIYFCDTFFSPLFTSFSFTHCPPLLSIPFCCPPPTKAIIPLPFSLYLHDTEVSLRGRCRWQKAGFLQNGSGLISSSCFSSQPMSFIAELTVFS